MRAALKALASGTTSAGGGLRRGGQKGGPPGQDAGWSNPMTAGLLSGRPGSRQRITSLLNTYGGTDQSVTWVFACASLVASELASYDWEVTEPDGTVIEEPPEDLDKLLSQPNPRHTYFDFAELVGLDLEIAGNSFWAKDQMNLLNQPLALIRLRPEWVRIVTNERGDVIGYVYEVQGKQVPYSVEEVMHFRYPSPIDPARGMGTVEALIRAVQADLEETQHVVGFFANGARISGVLTTQDNLSDTQFERLKTQIQEEYGGSANAFKVLLAEQGMDFKPVTESPGNLGIHELRRFTKDEILSGFGVPEFLLGGTAQGGVYKMEEAQNIFSRTMRPKARRFQERMTLDLTRAWDALEFFVVQSTQDTRTNKIARGKALIGAGASINEARAEYDAPPLDAPEADMITMPSNVVPWNGLAAPRKRVGADSNVRGGQVRKGTRRSGVGRELVKASTRILDGAVVSRALPAPGETWSAVDMALPHGMETRDAIRPKAVSPQVVAELLADHARVMRLGVDVVRPTMAKFFTSQHARVLDRLSAFRAPGDRTGNGKLDKKELTPEALWDDAIENAALLDTYMPLVDELGATSLTVPARLVNASISWDAEHQFIKAARDRLGELIVRINETTRDSIAEQVEEGMRRGYSIPQLANGVADEGFPGIRGVFADATAARAETIARSESAMIYNAAANAGYREGGVSEVEVIDGNGDSACADANGQRWDVDRAELEPIAHPNCVRAFAPIV